MDELKDYFTKLYDDLPHQFRDKPHIKGLLLALAKQLNEVQNQLLQLNLFRSIDTAVGVQLDGIGDIVCLSRADALSISANNTIMDDDTYRKWLKYKIAINTSNGTYTDIMTAIKMLIGDKKIGYKETPSYPATAILDVSDLEHQDLLTLDLLRKIKAAGVRLEFNIFSQFDTRFFIDGTTFESERNKIVALLSSPKNDTSLHIVGVASGLLSDRFRGLARASPANAKIHIGNILLQTETARYTIALTAVIPQVKIFSDAFLSTRSESIFTNNITARNAAGSANIGGVLLTTERIRL